MNIHYLDGCAPVPLAHYLKALGILRLVSEQADREARAWWEGERFVVATTLKREEMVDFFLQSYRPTPAVSPWNKGSGFYYDQDPTLAAAELSSAPRFEPLRVAIHDARSSLDRISKADREVRQIKDEAKKIGKERRDELRLSESYKARLALAEKEFKAMKADLIPNLRLKWRGPHRQWLDAALVVEEDDVTRFPALLGTGGNDGRLDFTNNYFQRLAEVFDLSSTAGQARPSAERWFHQALFGGPARVLEREVPVGQFAPGLVGGANATEGPAGGGHMNPVDFILLIEGAILFRAATTRLLDVDRPARAVAPFAISGASAGYASAADSDESARGEQWMPLWSQAATLQEVRHLFAEGRTQIARRIAGEPLDFARAVGRLGIARGIDSFCRYGFIERNGQSNLAVPLGRFVTRDRALRGVANIDDLDEWLRRLRREVRAKDAPVRLSSACRRLNDAILAVDRAPDSPHIWQTVLLRLADIEAVQLSGSGLRAGPIPKLQHVGWVSAADDGSPEYRLAAAFALQFRDHSDSVRRHWVPLDHRRYDTTVVGTQARLRVGPELVIHGRSGIDDAIAFVERRYIEATRRGERRIELHGGRRASATIPDLAALLLGEVDVNRIMHLARALMAMDARAWSRSDVTLRRSTFGEVPDDGWLAIRLTMLPTPLPDGRHPHFDPAILRRLAAGDAATAFDLARRRLRTAGINTNVRAATASPRAARLWAAALAFPITRSTAAAFCRRVDPKNTNEERNS